MKSFIKIVGVLFLFTSVLFLQCKKEEATIVADQDLEMRSSGLEPCDVKLGLIQFEYHKFVPVEVPGYPGCVVFAEFVWNQLGSTFAFTDYAMNLPFTGCENLLQLSSEDLMYLSRIIEAEGKRILLTSLAKQNGWVTLINVKSFRSICSQKVKCMEPYVIKNEDILGYRGGGGGGIPILWSTRWERCGGGCCVTSETYTMVGDELIITGSETVQYGNCETSDIPVWPKITLPCISKTVVDPCSPRCPG